MADKTIKMDLEEFTQYDDFCEKFKPRKTTDDCYTPPRVYEVIKDWAVKRYGLEGRQILRPFYPGGDFENEEYPPGCVVIDNPPFSILSKIERFYIAHGIDFFLFAPGLTIFKPDPELGYVICAMAIRYENGAEVPTSFVTNMGDALMETAPELTAAINAAQATKPEIARYEYPPSIVTAAKLRYIDSKGVRFAIKKKTPVAFVRKIDANKAAGIFGGGFLLPQAAAQAAAQAEAQAAAQAAARVFSLSARELALQEYLTKREAAADE